MTGSRTDLLAALAAPLRDGPALRLALLFGSHARGTARADSDVDIGVIPRDPMLSLADESALQVALERACGRAVHLVRLDRAGTLLKWQAARDGVALLAEYRREHVRFVAAAGLEYAEAAPALARVAEAFRARLAAGGGSHR